MATSISARELNRKKDDVERNKNIAPVDWDALKRYASNARRD